MASPVLSAHLAAIFREFRRSWLRAWSTTESPCLPQDFSRFFAQIRGDRKCGEAVTRAEQSYRRPQSSSRATDAGTTRGGEPVMLSTLGPRVESRAQSAKMGRRRTLARADPVAEARQGRTGPAPGPESVDRVTDPGTGPRRGAARRPWARSWWGRARAGREGYCRPGWRGFAPTPATRLKRGRDARPGTRRPIPGGGALHLTPAAVRWTSTAPGRKPGRPGGRSAGRRGRGPPGTGRHAA